MKLKVYPSPEKCYASMFKISVKELMKCTIPGVGLDGKKVDEVPAAEVIEQIRRMGFWGYADREEKRIHVWVDKSADPADVMYFLGHECGHVVGKIARGEIKEELRANTHGESAQEAYKLLMKIRPEIKTQKVPNPHIKE